MVENFVEIHQSSIKSEKLCISIIRWTNLKREQYTNIDCSWGEWWKLIVPEVKFNLDLLFTEDGRAEGNSWPRLNFTEGAIIFYHSPDKRAVNFCFIHLIHRFFSPYQTVKIGCRVPNSAAVTASLSVRKIVKNNTHGLVSKHEHCRISHVMWPSFNQSDDLNPWRGCIIWNIPSSAWKKMVAMLLFILLNICKTWVITLNISIFYTKTYTRIKPTMMLWF